MFELLANVDMSIAPHIDNPEDMVTIWTGCMWGIGACVIWTLCLLPFSKGILLGSLANTVYLVIGICVVLYINDTSYGTKMMYLLESDPMGGYLINKSVCIPENWFEQYNYTINSDNHPPDVFYLMDQDAIARLERGTGYRGAPEILRFYTGETGYAMNIKASGKFLCSPHIFNPTSCIIIPLICSIPAFLFMGVARKAVDGF
jgi:hypothetical protein